MFVLSFEHEVGSMKARICQFFRTGPRADISKQARRQIYKFLITH